MKTSSLTSQDDLKELIESAKDQNVSRRLAYIYKQVPTNDCQRCGDCCFNGPQVHFIEFLNMCVFIRALPEPERTDLSKKIVQYELLNLVTLDNECPFLTTDGCVIYEERPLQCHLFGLYPTGEYKKMVENSRLQNRRLAEYYRNKQKLKLPMSVMTYDIEQCANNFDEDGNLKMVTEPERRRLHDQISMLSREFMASDIKQELISFSNRYSLLFVEERELEDVKMRASREFLRDGASTVKDDFLSSLDFSF